MSLSEKLGVILAIVIWTLAIREGRKPENRIPWRDEWNRIRGRKP